MALGGLIAVFSRQRTVRHQNVVITGLADQTHIPAASLPEAAREQARLSFLLPLLAFAVLALFGAVALYSTLSGSRDPAQLPSVLVGKQHHKQRCND